MKDQNFEMLIEEIKILSSLTNTNIIKLIAVKNLLKKL